MKKIKNPQKIETRKMLAKVARYVQMCAVIGENPLTFARTAVETFNEAAMQGEANVGDN